MVRLGRSEDLCTGRVPLSVLTFGSVRYVQGVTAFPAGVQAAATWDTALMYSRGNALGAEARGVGVNVQLGPVAGELQSIVLCNTRRRRL